MGQLGGHDAAMFLGWIAVAGGLCQPVNLSGCLLPVLSHYSCFSCLTASTCFNNNNNNAVLELFSPLPASLLVLCLLEEKLCVDVKILAPLSRAIAFGGGQISPTVFAFLPLSRVCLQNLLLNCCKPPSRAASPSQFALAFSRNQSVLIKIIMSFESREENQPKVLCKV